jgi:hypothetical protein
MFPVLCLLIASSSQALSDSVSESAANWFLTSCIWKGAGVVVVLGVMGYGGEDGAARPMLAAGGTGFRVTILPKDCYLEGSIHGRTGVCALGFVEWGRWLGMSTSNSWMRDPQG